jgi:hypothetical protein
MSKPISSPPQSEPQPGSERVLNLHTPGTASLLLAACIATIAWLSLAAQTDITVHRMLARGLSVFDGIERLGSYLTNLTVFAVALSFSCVAALGRSLPGRFFRQPPVVTAVVVYIVFVGLAYNLLLRHLWTPSGYRAVLNECLHTVLPVLSVIYWVLFVPRFHLSLRQCLLWLVYPLSYLCITLWRGSTSDFYPYPFIDVGELGYPHVLFNATLLVLAFVTLMGVFIALNHRRAH